MAVLSAADRKKIPASKFLGPGRTFPGNDAEHLRKAIQLAPRSYHAGNISLATMHSIQAKARKRLGSKTAAEDGAR